jgi:hypothetical protein
VRLASVGLAAVIVAVACWLLLRGGEDEGEGTASTAPPVSVSTPPAVVDSTALRSLSAQLGHPLYWAGKRPGTSLELTREGNGDVYVRYLTGGAKAGDPQARFVTVGTYPVPDAVAAVRRAAAEAKVEVAPVAHGGVAFTSPGRPGSVYLAYPGADYQIEVFTPKDGEALRLVKADRIVPVG